MLKWIRFLFTGLILSGIAMQANASGIDEGIEYQLVTPPVRTTSENKIEVVEMFWYGCPHCYKFEKPFNAWKKKQSSNVEVIRIPAVFGNRRSWELHARAYYAAELLGVLDKIHTPLFTAIHQQKQKLLTKEALADFFEKQGVNKSEFLDTLYSFGVNMKLNRAIDLTKRYGIDGVPTIIINGRYRTHASLTNGQAGMLKVMDFLINKESQARK